MSVNDELFAKAYELWSSFKKDILYKNRFIINHEVLDYIKYFVKKNQKFINKDTILYRARMFTGDERFLKYLNNDIQHNDTEEVDTVRQLMIAYYKSNISSKQESGFWGYDEKDSFVPTNNDFVNDGRANPVFIKYLYTAEEPYTALVEVRPYLNSKVSVAEIRLNDSLIVADFSFDSFGNFEGFEQILIYLIMRDFSNPSNSDRKKYIPTQYIAEYIKTLGFDGIRFNSSLHRGGKNIPIFNYEKCNSVGSKLYQIEDICFEAEGIAPKDEEWLIHKKLKEYKKVKFDGFIQSLKIEREKNNQ